MCAYLKIVPVVFLLALSACEVEVETETETEVSEADFEVVQGVAQPDWQYPWVVSLNGCRGVIIEPKWVLTAAHCVPQGGWGGQVIARRTDPVNGQVRTQTRSVRLYNPGKGVFIHPQYEPGGGFSSPKNDIALLRLEQPFTIDPLVQTVGLPKAAPVIGRVGSVASGSHSGAIPDGHFSVYQTAIPATPPPFCAAPAGAFCVVSDTSALCPGDSGSGFVTVENGRATATGTASYARSSSCDTVEENDYVGLTDVYAFRSWILQTMNQSAEQVAGNTRVRRGGKAARGTMGVGCVNPYGTLWAPMNVTGAEVGANCEAGQTMSVVCSLGSNQTLVISGFTMRTTNANGTVTTQQLPFSAKSATYFGTMPAGVSREFTCSVTLPFVAQPIGGVLVSQ